MGSSFESGSEGGSEGELDMCSIIWILSSFERAVREAMVDGRGLRYVGPILGKFW